LEIEVWQNQSPISTLSSPHLKAETAALADSREEEGRRLRRGTAEAAMEMTAAIIDCVSVYSNDAPPDFVSTGA
jgi:hypothetical protein